MKQDIRLYIDNQLVDFSDELSLPFNYEFENLSNPTQIKNFFTKKITIVGTPNNNKIFGGIYKLDREQILDTNLLINAYYNPSLRTPFILFRNGDVIESGYMQLNNVILKSNTINYNITLYGNIGDFFQTLSYNADNEPLKLSNIDYGQKIDFILDKNIIKNSWYRLNGDGDMTPNVTDYITFIPSYNGLYNDFDNNKVLINTNKSSLFPNIAQIVDGVSYGSRNGYYLGELNNEYTEWEMKSLMSFKQRPALRYKKLIEAICNPNNNGGYEVVLDNTFFNNNNPYYNNAYIALPLIESKLTNTSNETLEDNVTLGKNNYVGNNNGSLVASALSPIVTVSNSDIKTDNNGVIDTLGWNNSTTFNVDIDFQLLFNGNTQTTKTLYPSAVSYRTPSSVLFDSCLNSVLVYVNAINYETKEIIAQSNLYNFTNKITLLSLNKDIYSKPSDWNFKLDDGIPVVDIFGAFEYDETTKQHRFKDENGNINFNIKVEDCKLANNISFQVFTAVVSNKDMAKQRMFDSDKYIGYELVSIDGIKGYYNIKEDTATSKMTIDKGETTISSGQLITQDLILKTDNTPLDYLLSYCKLFNLKFSSEIGEKKIYISRKNNYFSGDVVNIEDRIDYSNDIIINPILFDKKFYKLSLPSNDSYVAQTYNNGYGVEYGQKRINTNYNFNNDTTELLENNVYQNVISIVDTSKYYRTFVDGNNNILPSFYNDNFTMKKYNVGINGIKEYGIDINGAENIKQMYDWNVNSGYDYTDKLCCFSKDGDTKSLSDITSSLVFFDGMYQPKDINGNIIQYWICDDSHYMYDINGKQCHLYTESEYDVNNNHIAWKVPYLPKFSRYKITNNMVIESWDIGKPREIYIPNITYDDNVTIYNQYWDSVYQDKLNVNTKVITANVDMRGFNVNENMFKKFYYFNNCYWLLNKIYDYDINSGKTVKCDFVKIINTNNYLKETNKYYNYFFTDKDSVVVDYLSGKITALINSSADWTVVDFTNTKITGITPINGTKGTTKITIRYNRNNNKYEDVVFNARFKNSNGEELTIYGLQKPDMTNLITLNGRVKNMLESYTDNVLTAKYEDGTIITSVNVDTLTGEYKLYLPKETNVILTLSVNTIPLWSNKVKFSKDKVYNITIS